MRPAKLRPHVLLVAAIALIVTLLPSTALGAASAAASPIDKPASELTRTDLQQFVELASSNYLTAAQVQTFIAKLSPAQEQTLRTLSEAKIRVDQKTKKRPPSNGGGAPAGTAEHGIPWSQLAEYQDPNVNSTLPWTWYTNTRYACDDQPDIEYIFVFDFNSDDPDRLRWKTDIGGMYWYLWTTRKLESKIFGETQHQRVDLCLSDTAVDGYGGGANNVQAHIWIGWIS